MQIAYGNYDCTHVIYAISKLAVQSQDSENAQCNLEIPQIFRLRGTVVL